MKLKPIISSLGFLLLFAFQTSAQTTITGKVVSEGETLIGANISLVGTNQGTVTDLGGKFQLEVSQSFPINLNISYTGYEDKLVEITAANKDNISIELASGAVSLNQVVVGASRYAESIIEAPVAIQKINARELKNSSSPDFYETMARLPGVHANQGSMTFTSLNTRGFADPNNLRFLQHIDGMDITSPGFGIIGNSAGTTELDVQSMELLPGASSALYGADAFNGLIRIYTKSPFDFPGLSFSWKTGVTNSSVVGNNPYNDISLRYAHVFNDKFAFKIDANHRRATDWVGGDLSPRTNLAAHDNRDQIFANSDIDNDFVYNAVNRYGDSDFGLGLIRDVELTAPDGSTQTTNLSRTGFLDGDLWNPEIRNYRLNASLHYKLTDDLELSYLYKRAHSDFSFRITTFYPFEDFVQEHHKVELKGKRLNARVYTSGQTANRTWIGFLAANSIQQSLKPDAAWAADFQSKYAETGSAQQSRQFADSYLNADGSLAAASQDAFNRAKETTLGSSDATTGGSKFIENSSFLHADLNYDFSEDLPFGLIAGGNFRRYEIDSKGSFFNDGPNGYNGPIPVTQFGIFTQATKAFAEDRLKLTGSIRYDKNENYDGNFTPRLSAVYTAGANREHNFRVSYQTGFRNPGLQESFIAFPLFSFFTILGGSQANVDNYKYTGATGNVITGPQLQQEFGFGAIEPEKNKTFDIGYKSLINNKFLIDANLYFTTYDNFLGSNQVVFGGGTPDFKVFLWYQNRDQKVTTNGFDLNMDYLIGNGFKVGGNFSYTDLDAPDFDVSDGGVAKEQFIRGLRFNSPKTRFNLHFSNTGFGKDKKWGFDVALHQTGEYFYLSAFGATTIKAFNWTDASVSYKIPKWKATVKVGGSNIFKQDYTHVYQGPAIGGLYFVAIRFDDLLSKK